MALMGAGGALEVAVLAAHWPEVVGAEAAAHTQPARLQGGALVVVVDHPAWAKELELAAHDVVDKARQLVGPAVGAVRASLRP